MFTDEHSFEELYTMELSEVIPHMELVDPIYV